MSSEPEDSLRLAARKRMPSALRVLKDEFPRTIWETHSNFDDLTRFWLDRHIMFRRLLAILQSESQAVADQSLDPSDYSRRLARYGGMFIEQLHAHHQIEDMHYFPQLVGLEPVLTRGFEILDRDHHDIDAHLSEFSETANGILRAQAEANILEAAKPFVDLLEETQRFLNRHLEDEEDLIVPVILKHGGVG